MNKNCNQCLRMNHESNFCSVFKTVIDNREEICCPMFVDKVIQCPKCGQTVPEQALIFDLDLNNWCCYLCAKNLDKFEQTNTSKN